VSNNNPGEKLNYFGTLLNNTSANQGGNFGYPECFAAWNISEIPNNTDLKTGVQFAIGTQNATNNDTSCQTERVAPRLVFQAHQAPLDIKFNTAGSEAWITFHGSWDRSVPVGYKISTVAFTNGEPTEPSTSNSAAVDIVSNTNMTACPGGCFRPVGLAFDSMGRLFFSSDATGEIYVITRAATNGSAAGNGSVQSVMPSMTAAATVAPSGTGSPTSSGAEGSASATGGAVAGVGVNAMSVLGSVLGMLVTGMAI